METNRSAVTENIDYQTHNLEDYMVANRSVITHKEENSVL